MPTYISTAEAAKLRCRTPQALAMERQRGEGPPYYSDGGRILYDLEELEEWMARHRVDPALVPRPKSRYADPAGPPPRKAAAKRSTGKRAAKRKAS